MNKIVPLQIPKMKNKLKTKDWKLKKKMGETIGVIEPEDPIKIRTATEAAILQEASYYGKMMYLLAKEFVKNGQSKDYELLIFAKGLVATGKFIYE